MVVGIVLMQRGEPMDDLISRQDAIDLFLAEGMITAAVYVERMSSAQQWILCSKQLPGADGTYLVYAPDYKGGSSSSKECHDGVMFSKFKNKKWSVEHGYYTRPNCVKAWMPLPEPYKEDEQC